ncbi:MAG: C40 family peptidase [Desulfobacula sp.]|jgi:cell wall-associated NlpC family hydrolase|uniref:C40 family peptidase n=1 Tax=Desulfobacula sp. TaxID=2593537 RepID=UPI001DAE2A07|nr:C40 family peptidase [Desulfobacula sp.]MBT3485422.1 C40 family peptidase [Desulfobacula sp.]MBT3805565.1 C40 family peptidase [Desulfobacula sp.]MBT4026061.1 C40 family peptidase [Desulfobacula sp.]MBT4199991.1 C40 family peptidase [Desulfobacula sp.]
MDKIKKYLFCLLLVTLTFSCALHKETDHKQPQPQPESQSRDTGSQALDSGLYYPEVKLSKQRKIVGQHAVQSLGLPYKWGGQSPQTGFDCSGLSSYTHKKAGIIIPRTAKAQFNKGQVIAKQNLIIGDLVFFKGPQKKGGFHVGIYIFNGIFIHAPGKGKPVSYGDLDNPYFKLYYIGSKRYL